MNVVQGSSIVQQEVSPLVHYTDCQVALRTDFPGNTGALASLGSTCILYWRLTVHACYRRQRTTLYIEGTHWASLLKPNKLASIAVYRRDM